jgi:diaminohydroxyphosphoribosylaminopyrimidine deaminase / 5-amino-6-(5-phosphoribosylamino)uracil reductase
VIRTDDEGMVRALARAAEVPFTSPNPRVGAVVVRAGRVIAEGSHRGPGHSHAEAAALESIDATGATVYVTLEPCVHYGRTPPCVPALVAARVGRVVVAMEDPDPRMRGEGLRQLEAHGIEVVTGVLADEAAELNAAYVHQRSTGRVYLRLKLALTLDGRLAAPDRSARWVTGGKARARVHDRRASADAVMVGAGTVAADNPRLTARSGSIIRRPVRVIIDSSGSTPPEARVFDPGAEVIVATTARCPHETQTAWKEKGAEVLELGESPGGVDLGALLRSLSERGWLEVLCEGGARLATSLLAGGHVDRLELHYGPLLAGRGGPDLGDLGITTLRDAPRWEVAAMERAGDDMLLSLTPPRAN